MKNKYIFYILHEDGKEFWYDLTWGNSGRGNGWIGAVPWGLPRCAQHRYDYNQQLIDPDNCEFYLLKENKK